MFDVSALSSTPWLMEPTRLESLRRSAPSMLSRGMPLAAEVEAREAAAGKKLRAVKGKVAVIPVHGVIEQRMSFFSWYFGGTSTEMIGAVLDEMLARKDIEAIVMDVDSPGGSVYGVEELSDKIFQARAVKPIYSLSNSEMYSAAYWIGTSATQAYVTNGGGVGSVGVYIMHTDWTKALEADGIGVKFIRKPEHKADTNPYEELTEDAEAHLQSIVDDTYAKFVGAVARNRGAKEKDVRDNYGGGRIVLASQAHKAGMVDGIKTMDQMLAELTGGDKSAANGGRGRASVEVLRMRAEQRKRGGV